MYLSFFGMGNPIAVEGHFGLRSRKALFVMEHSDLKNKYTKDDNINMVVFLVDIFLVSGGKVS